MLCNKETVFNAMKIFKAALVNERNHQYYEAITNYSNVSDIYYSCRHPELKYVCLFSIRSIICLSKATRYDDCWIFKALYHCEKIPWIFVKENDSLIRLAVVDIICEGIKLCLLCEKKRRDYKTAERLFRTLKLNYNSFPDKTIQRRINDATRMMKKHKEKKISSRPKTTDF